MIVIILQVNLFKYLLHSKLKLPYLNLREIGNDEVFTGKTSRIYWRSYNGHQYMYAYLHIYNQLNKCLYRHLYINLCIHVYIYKIS